MAQKNKYGQYFTPRFVADFMVSLLPANKEAHILEPSAGAGVFIDALEEAGYSNWTAYEIDASVIKHPRTIQASFVSAPITPRFDAVIGNPPYIRWKNLDIELREELSLSSLWANNFNALCDYLYFFIARSIQLLKPGGELVFICSDYWLNSTNGEALREFILKHGAIESIYHFREAQIFPGVSSSLMIFKFIREHITKTCKLYSYIGEKVINQSTITATESYDVREIPAFQRGARWVLATQEQQQRLQRLEQSCSSRGDFLFSEQIVHKIGDFFHIGNGLVSGLDKAFNLSHYQDQLSSKERNKTIKVVKAKDIMPYEFKAISPYAYIEDKEMTEEELKEGYPNIYAAIAERKTDLLQRYQYGRNIDFWSFTFPRNKKMFDSIHPRILVPCKDRISKRKHFRFCLVPHDVYPLQDATGIIPKDNCLESIEYAVAYLNSPPVYDWLMLNGIVKGEVVEFSEAPLASIPYRRINWKNKEEVRVHDLITKLIRESLKREASIPTRSINQLIDKLL